MGFLPANWEEIVVRLVLAVVLSGMIGMERVKTNHDAGLRTHILVCLLERRKLFFHSALFLRLG